jgi:predicted PurR-regulated permease PerM
VRIQNLFRLGLVGTLGFGLGLLIVTSVVSLQTIIVYIVTALFIALGLDPGVAWLVKKRVPRWAAIVMVFAGVLSIVTLIVVAVVPVVVDQIASAWELQPRLARIVRDSTLLEDAQLWFPYLDISEISKSVTRLATANLPAITTGAISIGVSLFAVLFGALIVVILSLYFTASLGGIARAAYQLVPASQRTRFIDVSEQMSAAVGQYIFGQGTLAFCNGILSFIFLSLVGAPFPALLAVTAFLLSLIPLIGTPTGSVLIVLVCLIPGLNSTPTTALAVGVFYLIYALAEAVLLRPRLMRHAVAIPGAIVLIAVLAGGTLLGPLGVFLAIPLAAALLVLVKQVIVPRQAER